MSKGLTKKLSFLDEVGEIPLAMQAKLLSMKLSGGNDSATHIQSSCTELFLKEAIHDFEKRFIQGVLEEEGATTNFYRGLGELLQVFVEGQKA